MDKKELSRHIVDKCEIIELDYSWPRFVGNNGMIDFHGQEHKSTILKIHTNQGAKAGVYQKNK